MKATSLGLIVPIIGKRGQPGCTHMRASLVLLAAVLWLCGSGAAEAAAPFARARFVQQISQDTLLGPPGSQDDTQAEPHIAVDPNDPQIVVAVFQQGRFTDGGSVDPGYATSQDGGQSWIAGDLPGLTVAVGGIFGRASDPVVAIGPDGSVYAQTLGIDGNNVMGTSRSAIIVQRSDDGGLTFGAPVLVQDDVSTTLLNDKNWIAVDTFPTSPHYGRVYSAWDRVDDVALQAPQVLRYSDDRGETWSPLVTVSTPAPLVFSIGAQPLVQPNGDLTIVYNVQFPPPSLLLSQTSHDGGDHFDPPATIATAEGIPVPGMRTGLDGMVTLPAAAVDPVDGEIYVVWPDARFRSDGLNDIAMSISTDGGASWGAPTAVSSVRKGRLDRFTPAVAAHGEYVHVTYHTVRIRDGVPVGVGMRYIVSADDGATFRRERRLGRRSNLDFAAVVDPGGLKFLGDYNGLAATADAVHAVWCRSFRERGAGESIHQTTFSAALFRQP